jgi:major vault protein
MNVYRLKPYTYVHVLDQNTNVTRVETGPKTFVCQDHEHVVTATFQNEQACPMIVIPPRCFLLIENPVVLDDNGVPQSDKHGQILLKHGEREVRLAQEPFPLYPGEQSVGKISQLKVVPTNRAIKLRANRNFVDRNGVNRTAGDEYLFEGPGTYIPDVHEDELVEMQAVIIGDNQALRLRAKQDCVDREGNKRVTGEEWLVTRKGAYLPAVHEEQIGNLAEAHVQTETRALHVRALRSFTDKFGNARKNGDEWLVTKEQAETYVPGVYEQVVTPVKITVLTNRQYAVILDPYDSETGTNRLGQKKLIRGEATFFLQPGERLRSGKVDSVEILSEFEGLVMTAEKEFVDDQGVTRGPGDRWLVKGPCEYVPPKESTILARREAIPLDKNEGIYVRNIKSGDTRKVTGETYMLNEDEELWEKELPNHIEALLCNTSSYGSSEERHQVISRDRTRVISYRVPHNGATQVYDYKTKASRVVFGPNLVMLAPDEQFTPLSLSGGKPKRPDQITSLHLMLGPDFMTDDVTVETSDHARLKLRLSYNWRFKTEDLDPAKEGQELFSVADFIGDACKAVASRVRGAVAGVPFDEFHKLSAKIIRASVFGMENGKVRDEFFFPSNKLLLTGIDIQSVDPIDKQTRIALQGSVQLAIEITTKSQEDSAKQEAARIAQEAKGVLERLRIENDALAEEKRKDLEELRAETESIMSSGRAKAEASSKAEAARIRGMTGVEVAKLKAQSKKILAEAALESRKMRQQADLSYQKKANEIQAQHDDRMAKIESEKFRKMIGAIGADTLQAIAQAGPELQAKLLGGLGIKSTLIVDGKNPLNLFSTAKGLIMA